MDEAFGNRAAEVRTVLGPHLAKTKVTAWARALYPGLDVKSEDGARRVRALRNLELGHRPNGGLPALEAIYAELGDVATRVAIYVDEGRGSIPKPVTLDDASDPRPTEVAAALDAVPVLERILGALDSKDAKAAVETVRTITATALDLFKSANGRFSGMPAASRNYREWHVFGVRAA